jgi:hypothetical protein
MMKPSPKHDFPVNVRREEWEQEPSVAPHYEGIFAVTLNHTISILFIPGIDRTRWPPSLPEDTDRVASAQEAREVAMATSRYSVMPDVERAGTEETFFMEETDTESSVVFYVAPQEFENYSRDLARLAHERPSVHDARSVSEIAKLGVGKFLLARFVRSPHLSPRHRQLLGR